MFVLASPSGTVSGRWSVLPWQELPDSMRYILRVARKPDERGIIRRFGTSCPQRGQPDRMTLTTAKTPTNAGKP